MPYIQKARPMVHYRFTDEELASFNAFKVSMIPARTAYDPVDESEGVQSAKRVKTERSIFTTLPSQICLRIFDYLEPRDLLRVVATSKGWEECFLKDLPNQYIVFMSTEQQKVFYQVLCARPGRLFGIRSILHFGLLKKSELTKLLVSQPRFPEENIVINKIHFLLRSTLEYKAYEKNLPNDRLVISDVRLTQDAGPRQQMIAVKVLEALLAGSEEMKNLTLQGLIMQMPYGFGFFQGKHFPVLESLDLSRSNIRIDHLTIILKAAPCLVELNLSGCDRLEKGDFTKISDQVLLSYLLRLDLTETAVGEEDILAWRTIAPNFHQMSVQDFSF